MQCRLQLDPTPRKREEQAKLGQQEKKAALVGCAREAPNAAAIMEVPGPYQRGKSKSRAFVVAGTARNKKSHASDEPAWRG